jgi:hypothetical protein
MPRVPRKSLTFFSPFNFFGKSKQDNTILRNGFKKQIIKEKLLIYSFIGVLLIEVSSLLLESSVHYVYLYFPLLSQLSMFVLVWVLASYSTRLRFCDAKKYALNVLSIYYLFNFIAIIVGLDNYIYSIITNIVILSTSFLLFVYSLIRKK